MLTLNRRKQEGRDKTNTKYISFRENGEYGKGIKSFGNIVKCYLIFTCKYNTCTCQNTV